MKSTRMQQLLRRSWLVGALLGLLSGPALAQTNLVADEFDWNGIPMWGFAADIGQPCGDPNSWAPGPPIEVNQADGLTINLRNCLAEPVSIVIPGQALKGTPQVNAGRVTAFTDEAAPYDGVTAATVSYTWSPAELKTGTYLYLSGSHPAKQVHMGLYGPVVVNFAPGFAYDGVPYDRDIVVLYSEVDPELHATAAAAQPLNFRPSYFMINGDAFGSSILTKETPAPLNTRVLLRFVNAGLKSYVPTLLGEDLDFIAEDGNLYPHVRRSYSAFLGAGKTMDAIWVPNTVDRHALYDRRLYMSENGDPTGGIRAYLDSADVALPIAVAGPPPPVQAVWNGAVPNSVDLDGTQSLLADGTTSCEVAGTCAYEWTLVGFPAGASQDLLTGELTGTPQLAFGAEDAANPGAYLVFPGAYTLQLVVTDGGITSSPDTVTVLTNLPPVAVAGVDSPVVDTGAVVQLYGGNHCSEGDPALGCSSDGDCNASSTDVCVFGSSDPNGDAITYSWSVNSIFLSTDPNPTFTTGGTGDYVAALTVSDFEISDDASVTVTAVVHVNQPPDAVNDFYEIAWKTVDNPLNVLQNDSDPDGSLVQSSLTIVTEPIAGSIAAVVESIPDHFIIEYTPKPGFKGTDFLTYSICDNEASCSEAEVLINVVK